MRFKVWSDSAVSIDSGEIIHRVSVIFGTTQKEIRLKGDFTEYDLSVALAALAASFRPTTSKEGVKWPTASK